MVLLGSYPEPGRRNTLGSVGSGCDPLRSRVVSGKAGSGRGAGVALRELAAGELDLLAPLWIALQEHHARITPSLAHATKRDAADSWRRRRRKYERWLDEPGAFAAVAERDGDLVGYAFVTVGPGFASWASGEQLAELQTLSVAPEARGERIGTLLLELVVRRLAAAGVEELKVTSTVANEGAHRFYERRGLERAFVVFFGRAAGTGPADEPAPEAPRTEPAPKAPGTEPARPAHVVGLDHVLVAAPAGSEPEARRFYGELLGLPEIPRPAPLRARGGAWFALGAQQLHIGEQEPFVPARKAHPAVLVAAAGLNELADRLASAGARVQWDTRLPGRRRFYTEDPWGNRLELLAEE